MFTGSSNNKNKRRTFFLFGSDSKNNDSPGKTKEKNLKPSTIPNNNRPISHKTIGPSPTQPLSKPPLKNTELALENIQTGNDDTFSKNSNKSTTITSNNQISRPHMVQRNKIRRPPPPVIEADTISKSLLQKTDKSKLAKSELLKNNSESNNIDCNIGPKKNGPFYVTSLNTSQKTSNNSYISESDSININEKGESFNIQSTSDNGTFEEKPSISSVVGKNHRTQKSEAEKLVNDIETYIKEYQEESSNINDFQYDEGSDNKETNQDYRDIYSNCDKDLQDELNIEPVMTNFDHLHISEHSSLANPISNVSPLNVVTDSDVTTTSLKNSLTIKNVTTNGLSSSNYLDGFNSDSSFSNSLPLENEIEDEFSYQENTNLNSAIRDNSYNPFFNTTAPSTSSIHISHNNISNGSESDVSMRDSLSYVKTNSSDNYNNGQQIQNEDYTIIHPSNNTIFQSEEPQRKLRVANEDHSIFFIKDDASTTDNDTDTIQSTDTGNKNGKNYTNIGSEEGAISTIDSHHSINDLLGTHTLSNELSSFRSNSSCINSPILANKSNVKSEISTINSGAKSINGGQSFSEHSSRSTEHTSKLVSSYVEELRLKYFPTSNFLEAPPNLPLALKQKNNLIQPKNIKVKIRTSTKQVGIKHGKVKQKLLSLETAIEDNKNISNNRERNSTFVDHTKEFHKFFSKENEQAENHNDKDKLFDSDSDYLNDIPGDEAYNSDDILAPLREKKGSSNSVSRSGTVISYYTRSKNNILKQMSDIPDLPSNISINNNQSGISPQKTSSFKNGRTRSESIASISTQFLTNKLSGSMGLHVTNPDSDSDS